MAVQVETTNPNIIAVRVSGKLSKADYETFVPEVERLIEEHDKVRILFEMRDFHGWELGALWEDTKFDIKHFTHIERLAMLGDKKWEKGMAAFCRPFTTAKIRYFDVADEAEARSWITGD
jgi:translation initiation factor IF-3